MSLTRGRRGARVALVALAWYAGAVAVVAEAVTPREAIERATVDRLGAGAVVASVGDITTTVLAQPALVAVPDPAGYVGQAVRFVLMVNGERRGVAVAAVQVRARVARAVKAIERDQAIDAEAIVFAEDEVKGVHFGRLPQQEDLMGARARRSIAPGEVVTSGMVSIAPDVQNGDRVTVGVTIGRVHVTGDGIASGSGHVGDVVHVRQAGRRGLLKARIMQRGVVELMP